MITLCSNWTVGILRWKIDLAGLDPKIDIGEDEFDFDDLEDIM